MEIRKSEAKPAPRLAGVPILGILPKLWQDPLGIFLKAGTEHPHIVRLDLGPAPAYLVSHPDGVKYVLQDNNRNFVKGYDKAKPVLGDGLVSSEGELWRRQRRLMQPAFHKKRLAELLPLMVETTGEMLAEWQKIAETGQPIDIAREIMLLTQTIIVKTMFSTDVGDQAEEIAGAFASTLEYLNMILLSPFSLVTSLPIPINRRFRRAMNLIDSAVYGIIQQRRETGVQRNDLVQMLMDARDEETGEGMSEQQMHDELLTIFLAGHETTAALLSWTFYLLAQHPQAEERVREELAQVLSGRTPEFDDLSKLTYTGEVLHESLRLNPPAWMFARQSVEEDEVGGYRIPARATIFLSPYVTHRLPQFWEQPEQFIPERFDPETSRERPRYAFFPFGGGPRLCIGNNFALMEAPAILSMVLQSFRLKLTSDRPVKVRPVATLRPHQGLSMHLERC